jgi:hypothetical protein
MNWCRAAAYNCISCSLYKSLNPSGPVTDVVAVQQHRVVPRQMQSLLHDIGDRGLARAGKAREPEAASLLCVAQTGPRTCQRLGRLETKWPRALRLSGY